MGQKLAIDFGTTNSVVARWNETSRSAEVLPLPGLSAFNLEGVPPIIPSLLYVHDGDLARVTLGQAVRDQELDLQKNNRLFRNFKRGIVATPAPEPRLIDGKQWSDRQAGEYFLRQLLEALPDRDNIDQLVVTVPVASFRGYVDWLHEIVGDAAEKIRVVDESTAAALGYAVTEPGALVLVFDFGGGTLDLSLVQLPENRERTGGILILFRRSSASGHAARVMAKAGRVIGGSDVDHWLLAEALKQTHLTKEQLGHDYTMLLTHCEQAKIDLSSRASTSFIFEAAGRTHMIMFTRDEFEHLLEANGFYLPPEAISLDAAAAALNSKDFYVRYNTARLLRRRGDRDARVIVEDALMNGNAPTRASVARELYGFSWFSAEPLLRIALKDEDERVHECAVYALCDLRELRGYQLLVEILPNESDHVKAAAAWGLHNCQDPEAVPVLQAALRAKDPDVRVKTLEALGANDTPGALPVVRAALDDPDPDVKYAATLSLVELQEEEGFPEIARLVEQTSGVTHQQILRGFFHATNYLLLDVADTPAAEVVLNALEEALLDPLPETRLAAIWPLAWIRHPRASHILERAYRDEPDGETKASIVKIAHNLMSEARDEILLDAAQSSDEAVKEAAEQIRVIRGEYSK